MFLFRVKIPCVLPYRLEGERSDPVANWSLLMSLEGEEGRDPC